MLEEQEKYEEAKEILQSIIIQHPHHSASHLLLAQIMGDEGGEIQAILGFQKSFLTKLTTEGFPDLKSLVKYRKQFKLLSDLINT